MQNFWTMKCQWPCMLLLFAIAMTMFSLHGSVILDCPMSARPTDKTIYFTCSVLKNGSLKILVNDQPAVNVYINQKTGVVIDQSGINSTILVRNQSLTMVSVQVVVDGTDNYSIQCKDTMNAADNDRCFIEIVNCPPPTNFTVRQLNNLLRIELNHSDDSIDNDDVIVTISKIRSMFSRTILANTKRVAVDFDNLTFGEYIINVTVPGCHSSTVMIDYVGGVPDLKEFSVEVDMINKRIHLKGDIKENGPLIDRVIISFPNKSAVIVLHPKSTFDYTFNSLQTSVVMVTPANSYGNGTTLTKNIIIPTNISLDTTNTSSWLLCIKGINQQLLHSYRIYYNETVSVNGTFTAINNTCDRVMANGFSNIKDNITITVHVRVDTTTMISYYITAEIINRHNIPTIGPSSHSGSNATIATSSLLWLILGGLLLVINLFSLDLVHLFDYYYFVRL